jgi:hypothetical protein
MLNHQREQLDPTPPLPHHAELNLPIKLANRVILPLATEEAEQEEEEDSKAASSTKAPPPNALAKYLDAMDVSKNVQVEQDETTDNTTALIASIATSLSITTVAVAATTSKPVAVQKASRPADPRVTEAELWARQRCVSAAGGKSRCPPSALRAYYLWYKNSDLKPEDVAALLRDPPLKTGTVLGYITESVRIEKLQFEKGRMRREVLAKLPAEDLSQWRYKSLVIACKEGEE